MERPILFSTPMVQAILDGRKTMTRRVIKGTALEWLQPMMFIPEFVANPENNLCPYGKPGDILWVRETWNETTHGYNYKASPLGNSRDSYPWRPSIFMPREACRIKLLIKDVRVERLQDITEEDARAEGYPGGHSSARSWFRELWDNINAKRGFDWYSNEWVWVVKFERI